MLCYLLVLYCYGLPSSDMELRRKEMARSTFPAGNTNSATSSLGAAQPCARFARNGSSQGDCAAAIFLSPPAEETR